MTSSITRHMNCLRIFENLVIGGRKWLRQMYGHVVFTVTMWRTNRGSRKPNTETRRGLYLFSSVHLFAGREFLEWASHSSVRSETQRGHVKEKVLSILSKHVSDSRDRSFVWLHLWAGGESHLRRHLSDVLMSQTQPQIVILVQHYLLHPGFSHPAGLKPHRHVLTDTC